MVNQLQPREPKEFEAGDRCRLLERYDVGAGSTKKLWLLKGTLIEITGAYFGGAYEATFTNGAGIFPATLLRKLCPLELLALEADPYASEEEIESV
jgi:hypothetical protein